MRGDSFSVPYNLFFVFLRFTAGKETRKKNAEIEDEVVLVGFSCGN